ncbi:Efflux pump terJ [Vanrija pseudolonga]|uniref:Efflux pump terJ n=1 Tax=Vanrija pseudolonga TaxID=143232 RepID=A0AAF0YD63_9TREE|nr:Efflux pump terJ [Vanrija pseudolonga]
MADAEMSKPPDGASKELVADSPPATHTPHFSASRKWSLLLVFSFAMFVDIWFYAAFYFFTYPISLDLGIVVEQQSWVITSYAATFAAFLLFWGRFADLYTPKLTFVAGLALLGLLSLVTSFLTNKYAFFIFRALAGIAGAMLVPASYRLISYVFEPHELGRAFTLFNMSGSIASATGTVIAGFIEHIPGTGQMTAWRWFFRIVAALVLPVAGVSYFLVPDPREYGVVETEVDEGPEAKAKWHKLDLVGSLTMLAAIVLLILGLTFGASYGFRTAAFLVPFLFSFVLFPAFFVWEARLPDDVAILPSKTWRIPNFTVWIVFGLQVYAWWSVNYLALVEVYVNVHHDNPVIAAVRLLPQGIAMFVVSICLSTKPVLLSKPRWSILVGMALAITGYVMFSQSRTQVGKDYWRFVFPGGILGCGGMTIAFAANSVGVMTSVPKEMSGVAGAVLQVSYQVGSVVSFSIQAGMFTVNPGGFYNWSNVQASFYFQIGWMLLWTIGFFVFYRSPRKAVSSEEADSVEQARVE